MLFPTVGQQFLCRVQLPYHRRLWVLKGASNLENLTKFQYAKRLFGLNVSTKGSPPFVWMIRSDKLFAQQFKRRAVSSSTGDAPCGAARAQMDILPNATLQATFHPQIVRLLFHVIS